jgi:predicted MFS family arabinose efflux permease
VAAIGGGLLLFCLAGVILGLGYTFYSGAVEAWMVDALKATGYTHELDPVFARSSIVSSVAMIVGTVGGGLLGQINLSIPYLARAGLVLIAFAVGFRTMHDVGFTPRTMRLQGIGGEMRKVARAGITYGWRKPAVRLLVMESFLMWGFFMWAWYAWQPYFLDLYGENAIWLSGVIAAFFALAGIAGNALVGRLATPGRRRTTILLGAAAISTTTMVATGVIQSFWVTVPVFLLGAVAGGILQPVRQTYLHHSIPTSERATLVSFDSLVGSMGGVVGQTGLGYLSQERSIPVSFVVGGLATVLALPIFARLRALNEPADRITAEAPEAEATPAVPGTDEEPSIVR